MFPVVLGSISVTPTCAHFGSSSHIIMSFVFSIKTHVSGHVNVINMELTVRGLLTDSWSQQ